MVNDPNPTPSVPGESPPANAVYPLPPQGAALTEQEAMDFATAKGCVAHYASVAADTINTYAAGAQLGSTAAKDFIAGILRGIAKDAYDAPDVKAWQGKLCGGSNGSIRIGVMLIAREMVRSVLEFDKSLPDGDDNNPPGTLSKAGLTKLVNGFGICFAGFSQHMPQGDANFKPNLNSGFTYAGIKGTFAKAINDHNATVTGETIPKISASSLTNFLMGR